LPSDTNESSDDDDVHDEERYQRHIVESATRKYVYVYVSNVYLVFKTNLSPNLYRGDPTMFYGRGRSFGVKRNLKSGNVSLRCHFRLPPNPCQATMMQKGHDFILGTKAHTCKAKLEKQTSMQQQRKLSSLSSPSISRKIPKGICRYSITSWKWLEDPNHIWSQKPTQYGFWLG
jgi:hypothetical protein